MGNTRTKKKLGIPKDNEKNYAVHIIFLMRNRVVSDPDPAFSKGRIYPVLICTPISGSKIPLESIVIESLVFFQIFNFFILDIFISSGLPSPQSDF